MELETTLVSENFNELQTALASLLADCDDVLSQSRLGPSSFLLSCCFLFFVCRLLHCRVNERRPCSMQNRSCCTVLSQQRTSDYMGIYSIFYWMTERQNAEDQCSVKQQPRLSQRFHQTTLFKSARRLKRNNIHRHLSGDVKGFFFFFKYFVTIPHSSSPFSLHCPLPMPKNCHLRGCQAFSPPMFVWNFAHFSAIGTEMWFHTCCRTWLFLRRNLWTWVSRPMFGFGFFIVILSSMAAQRLLTAATITLLGEYVTKMS